MHGYSSSSESDDPKRPRAQTTTSSTQSDQKKKKKKKPAPQQSINRIWKRFQKRNFSKAVAVLPFDPVQPPACPERPNELLSAGYDRAVDECRRKVRKIIQECRRINMRYRDAGFDLDWDLKYEKGHCLNSLGSSKFEVTRSNLHSSSTVIPKAVKRVHEIYEKPTFMKNLSGNDVKQGSLGDCWIIAGLTALAGVQGGLQRICVEYDTRIGIYGFVFYRDGEWVYSIIDDKLYLKSPSWDSPSLQRDLLQQIDREDVERVYRKTYQTGSKALFFAQNKDQNETWVPLIEKAYAKAHGDYGSLIGGWIGEGLEDLSGGVTTELLASDILDLDGFWDNELSKVNQEFLFGCSTGLLDGGYGDREGISEGHAYVVMDARTLKSGERLLKLRNPWGKVRKGMWEGAWSDGSKEWTTEVQEELGHTFGSDSVFWISYEDLLRKYQHFDRTRLFRDPDWRCCQRWIGVEVPWKSQWNEKFHIKLTRDSPLVLVLSQLDTRYFKGLVGQYSYRLHFRLHEKGRPGAEDYIVRSHGNYLMDRSVSIELPDMPAGDYTVFISVTGERDTDLTSPEDVVKRECRKRVENEKLAQVGYAYDLAHSKAWLHMEEVRRLRKQKDQKRASECRQKERRKQWERRHLNREIAKKQSAKNAEKNAEKKERRAARAAAEAKRIEEEEAAKKAEEKKEEDKKEEVENDEAKKEVEVKKEDEVKTDTTKESDPADVTTTEKPVDAADENKEDDKEKPKDQGVQTEPAAESKGEDKSVQTETDKTSEVPKAESGGEATEKPETKPDEKADTKSDDKPEGESVNKSEEKSETTPEKPEAKTAEEKDADDLASNSTSSPKDTPKSEDSTIVDSPVDKQPVPPVDGSPPAAITTTSTATTATAAQYSHRQAAAYESDGGESSDSPVEDWEELYSSDDMTRRPRMAAAAQPAPTQDQRYETEDESLPDPWNAVCIVGFRVYSKDEALELRVVMEGGEFLEGGMGEKGEADLDNAQVNAGGVRTETAAAAVPPVRDEPEAGDNRKSEEADDFAQVGSGSSTPGVATPEPTPLDGGKEMAFN